MARDRRFGEERKVLGRGRRNLGGPQQFFRGRDCGQSITAVGYTILVSPRSVLDFQSKLYPQLLHPHSRHSALDRLGFR